MRNFEHTKRQLVWWSEWVKAGRTMPNPALGFNTSSPEYKMLSGAAGGKGSKPGPRVPNYFNVDTQVEQLDRALARMERKRNELHCILCFYYLGGLKVRKIAAVMELSPADVNRKMRDAYNWLDGAMTDK